MQLRLARVEPKALVHVSRPLWNAQLESREAQKRGPANVNTLKGLAGVRHPTCKEEYGRRALAPPPSTPRWSRPTSVMRSHTRPARLKSLLQTPRDTSLIQSQKATSVTNIYVVTTTHVLRPSQRRCKQPIAIPPLTSLNCILRPPDNLKVRSILHTT